MHARWALGITSLVFINLSLYGFPIGGVAAFDPEEGGVISPGGIGFDINCGMRLVTTNLTYKEVQPLIKKLTDRLFERVPAGVGSQGFVKLNPLQFKEVVEQGAKWCIEKGYGWDEDLERTEENGCIEGANSSKISDKVIQRGLKQIGTLGSGNHYLEIQRILEHNIIDKEIAKKWGLFPDQIVIMFHCLPGDTPILSEYGTHIKIKDLENKKLKVKCFDPDTHKLIDTEIEEFYKVPHKERLFKIVTSSNKELIATEDHPVLTQNGLRLPEELCSEDKIAIYPFEGIQYEEPSNDLIVDEKMIRKIHDSNIIVNELKEKKLLPLKMNSPHLPILAKLLGYITGDGNVRKAGRGWRFSIAGDKVDLIKISEDIKKLGFSIGDIIKKETGGIIKSLNNKQMHIKGTSFRLECYKSALTILLTSLSVPVGKKTTTSFEVPSFILNSPKWIQRLYLAGYFGVELTKPILTKSQQKYNYFERLSAAVYKTKNLRENGFIFLKQISELLKGFNVNSKVVEESNGGRITNSGKILKLVLRISSEMNNLNKFFSKISYEYCERKSRDSSHVLYYLQSKLFNIETRARNLNVNKNSIKYKPYQYKFTFPQFSDFIVPHKLNPPTQVLWDNITKIKEIENNEKFVYDIRVKNKNHNFIANNFIVGNCGSRGAGHQTATDYLTKFLSVMESKYKIKILDRELACAPFNSPEGQDYFSAMKCAINMSFANRQVILHRIREVFQEIFKKSAEELEIKQVYDVAHNTAKLEEYVIDGKKKKLLVHRKGATRAFGPGNNEIPKLYRDEGQPIIIGGSMQTGSYLLVGTKKAEEITFSSTAHGSGRKMSRNQAKRTWRGENLQKEMEQQGIYVKTVSFSGLAEEAGGAYKEIDDVILAAEKAGISKRVCKLIPLGNVKG